MRKSNLLNRMNQSARDREVVVVRYRCKGDSKHTEEVMLRCEISHFKSKLKNVEEFVEKKRSTTRKTTEFRKAYGG